MHHSTETSAKQHPQIPRGSQTISEKKYYFHMHGEKTNHLEDTIRQFLKETLLKSLESRVTDCDFIVFTCIITSRTATDIDAAIKALNGLSEKKPAIVIVLHHTFDSDKTVPDLSRLVTRKNTLTVSCLFSEDEGLLNCSTNNAALQKIQDLRGLQISNDLTTRENASLYSGDFSVASELILILLGTSGPDKNAAESIIFGREEESITVNKTTYQTGTVAGGRVVVLNTPDRLILDLSPEDIELCASLTSSRPHVFILVIPLEQLRKEREMVSNMKKSLEEKCGSRLMVLLIADKPPEPNEIHNLKELTKCNENLFHVFYKSRSGNSSQVTELMEKVEKMLKGSKKLTAACDALTEAEIKTMVAKHKTPQSMRKYVKRKLGERIIWVSVQSEETEEGFVLI